MNRFFLNIFFITILSVNSLAIDPIRTNQIVMGTEPVRTNYVLMMDSVKSIFKKIFLGKGLGILNIQTENNLGTQKKYLDLLRSRCSECIFDTIRESHGLLSYKVTFPDGFYIVSSLDAGGLEWQTKPVSVNSFKDYKLQVQKYVYDLTEELGLTKQFDGMGGHISISGYGGDSFWVSNLFKLKAKHYDSDWGFWGKDSYNANIVARFKEEQRNQYQKVLTDHDESWRKFLIGLENILANSDFDLNRVITYFDQRQTMNVKKLMANLLKTYHNPGQEIPILGMRSKNKYVASRPDVKREMIENRAIRPQKNSQELSLLGKFFEAQAWYVKEKISQGFELSPNIDKFEKKSRKQLLSNVFQEIHEYGLDWREYKVFSKTKLQETEQEIFKRPFQIEFQEISHGAKKRDSLFKKILDSSLRLDEINERQIIFISKLINEMSYTSSQVQKNFNLFRARFPVAIFNSFPDTTKIKVLNEISSMGEKFNDLAGTIDNSKFYYTNTIINNFEKKNISKIVKGYIQNISKDEFEELYSVFVKKLPSSSQKTNFLSNFETLFNFKINKLENINDEIKENFELLKKQYFKSSSREISPTLSDIILKLSKYKETEAFSLKFSREIVKGIKTGRIQASNSSFKLYELLQESKSLSPRVKKQVNKNFKNLFLKLIRDKKYGAEDFYSVKVYIENLFQVTEIKDHPVLLEMLTPKLEDAIEETTLAGPHSGKSSPVDLKLLLKELKGRSQNHCLYYF